jgi:diaminopimelate epimerase
MKLTFAKYSGNGNDFIILRDPISLTSLMVKKLCHRNFGVGADGVLVLAPSDKADARMRIFNADGGEAEMCGNGLRCLATYLDDNRVEKKDTYLIQTMNNVYQVHRYGGAFGIEMSEIKDKNFYDLSVFTEYSQSFYVNTGVPHLIFRVSSVAGIDIKNVAPFYRHHPLFPNGTNVTFVEVIEEEGQWARARTYERGVEDETYSCGTGLTATGLALHQWLGWSGDIRLETKGGDHCVSLGDKIYYSGNVKHVFDGEIDL